VIVSIGGDEDYRAQLTRKPTYLKQETRQDDRVAGVKYRPKSGERSINEVFQMGQPSQASNGYPPQQLKIESRSMQTHDINGTEQGRNYQANIAAGVRNGSPSRKNESSVFSHLSADGSERDGLKRRDIYDIPKPKVIPNNLAVQRQPSIGMPSGPSGYEQ
jgi:hypothetical protein